MTTTRTLSTVSRDDAANDPSFQRRISVRSWFAVFPPVLLDGDENEYTLMTDESWRSVLLRSRFLHTADRQKNNARIKSGRGFF
jgi:hypothetical protein